MPSALPRPCSAPACGRLTTGRYCPDHHRDASRRYDRQRGSAAKRGYGRTWQKLREMVLRRDPVCVLCEQKGLTVPATEADHIRPKRDGGEDSLANLQGLCKSCHSNKTLNERQ